MKDFLKSVTNHSTMLAVFSFDRTPFLAGNAWTRSLLSGAISTAITAIGVYSGYVAMDANYAAALGSHEQNFKLATGAIIIGLLGYSLRDLFRSITMDVKTQMRVARANSWLMKGTASTVECSSHIHMQQTSLSMVRYVEVDGGIKVYAIARHHDHESPVLIDAMLFDEDYPALATFYTHPADIRSALGEACGDLTGHVARQLGIALASPDLRKQQPVPDTKEDDELFLDDDLLDDLETASEVFGRASAPRMRGGEALRAAAQVPTEAVKH
ncbi:hypothetical protein P3D53_14470 [Pseudomonas aeruginosa]